MAVTYTDLLRLGKPDPGTEDGTWGDVLNSQVIELLEDAVAGAATVSSWSGNAASLTAANGIPDQSRAAMLVLTGTLTAQGTLTVPAKNKVYAIRNNTNFPVAVVPAGGSGVVVPVGLFTMVHVLGTTAVGGNALTATQLQTARTIGGVSFNGTANINLPGVNTAGNQSTTGNAATATKLQTARTIGGVSFDGSANINLPGVNTAGNQSTTGNAATATKLQTARTIGGVSFDGSANINLPGVNTAGNQNTTGSAAKLTTARTIALSGDVTGSVSFDGSANATLTATVTDSDKLDGLDSSAFLQTSGGTMTGAITAIRETKVAMAASNVDLAVGNLFTKTITGSTTFTVSNVLASGNANSFILELTNGGSATVTWFSGTKWADGGAPELTASGVDILGFYSHDGGTTWRGMVLAKDSK
jgi:hypothetical protein